uniref:Uncharacterized protein n=1 Tax=Opuntia streptacantha TaxID=393608 RepID=A0A7C8ZYD8_OPUST
MNELNDDGIRVRTSVKNEGEILFGSAKANSDNVIARADGASGLSREAHSFLTNPVRLNHAGGQPGFHSPLDCLNSGLVLFQNFLVAWPPRFLRLQCGAGSMPVPNL